MKKYLENILILIFCFSLLGCPNRRSFLRFDYEKGKNGEFVIVDNNDVFISIGGRSNGSPHMNEYYVHLWVTIEVDSLETELYPDSINVEIYSKQFPLVRRIRPYQYSNNISSLDFEWIFTTQFSNLNIPVDERGRYEGIPIDIFLRGVLPGLPEVIIPEKITVIARDLIGFKALKWHLPKK